MAMDQESVYIVVFKEGVTDDEIKQHYENLKTIVQDSEEKIKHRYGIGSFRGYSIRMKKRAYNTGLKLDPFDNWVDVRVGCEKISCEMDIISKKPEVKYIEQDQVARIAQ